MELLEKLGILADAAKYDASCASSGTDKRHSLGQADGVGSTEGMGICHAYAPDGRCISLLKILLTNSCVYDCLYCINRRSSNVRRARFTVEEVVTLTLGFYRRNCIEGLFLSSGIIRDPDYTMEQVVRVARTLREEHGFRGYIHLKTIPDADPALLAEAGKYADRLSINVELPSEPSLSRLAPEKNAASIRRSMGRMRARIDEARDKRAPRFAPAGQSTQVIVGADASDDRTILRMSTNLLRLVRPPAGLLLGLQSHPGRGLGAASGARAAGARASALPSRLADALLRFRRRGNRHRRGGHARSRHRPQTCLGAGEPQRFPDGREPCNSRTAAACSRVRRALGRSHPRRAAAPEFANGRPRTAAPADDEDRTVRRDAGLPAERPRPHRPCPPPRAAADAGRAVRLMHSVVLADETDWDGWRRATRTLVLAGVAPDQVVWAVGESADLFGGDGPPPTAEGTFNVPRALVALAEVAILAREPQRFSLLYRLVWRAQAGERHLLEQATDPDVQRAQRLAQAVRRDIHKMRAFLRFRVVAEPEGTRYVAWFEPDHHILAANAAFFVRRFATMTWSILTPGRSAHWDGETLRLGPGADPREVPDDDALEAYWRTYFGAIFNPARLKVSAMTAEMPKKYWRNLPEARAIPDLIRAASGRTDEMLEQDVRAPDKMPLGPVRERSHDSGPAAAGTPLARTAQEAETCRRCPLWEPATQTVFGEGPADARVMFIGEQPGDQEDLVGRPFVGPAGQLLDRALEEAGIDRRSTYVTNAVKHFKFIPRGKRRIHQKPETPEIVACKFWLDAEMRGGAARSAGAAGRHRRPRRARPRSHDWARARPAHRACRRAGRVRHRPSVVPVAGARRGEQGPRVPRLRRRPAACGGACRCDRPREPAGINRPSAASGRRGCL